MTIDAPTIFVINLVGGGLGIILAARVFGLRCTPLAALVAATVSAAVYVIPSYGGFLSLIAMLLTLKFMTKGDWDDVFLRQ